MRYFGECNGESVRLTQIRHDGAAATTPEHFTGVCPICDQRHQATRRIDYVEAEPSRHLCNAKCLFGAVNGRCECRCGGKNHGRGGFLAGAALAPSGRPL